MAELIHVVAREMKNSADQSPAMKEVDRAKAQLKAGLLISLESSSARAEQMARQLLVYGRLIGVQELIERVDAVTPEGVRAFAEKMLGGAAASVCVVGAGEHSGHWAEHARSQLAV